VSFPFEVLATDQFFRDLSRLGVAARKRLEVKLREYVYPILHENPYAGPNIKRLKNWDPPIWRYRVGQWRFFYQIDEDRKAVIMTGADHRKEAYR
jgi:mRNA interferase RelE/StbE